MRQRRLSPWRSPESLKEKNLIKSKERKTFVAVSLSDRCLKRLAISYEEGKYNKLNTHYTHTHSHIIFKWKL